MSVVIAAAKNGEVRDLKRVGGATATLQGPRHRVAHVEVSLSHVGGQVELEETNDYSFAIEIEMKIKKLK